MVYYQDKGIEKDSQQLLSRISGIMEIFLLLSHVAVKNIESDNGKLGVNRSIKYKIK